MQRVIRMLIVGLAFGCTSPLLAGPIFLTGHDPDFHAQVDAGAKNLLAIGLDFVTGATTFDASNKFLWVEAFPADLGGVPGGHLYGKNGLLAIGLSEGVHFDQVNGAGFAGANLANYTAIAIASSFGGILSRAELDALIARSEDIKDFVNAGGGLFAASESDNQGKDLLGSNPDLFGYLPVSVTTGGVNPPFVLTPFGASLGLVTSDLQSATHNSFPTTGGLNIVDVDQNGTPVTLAADVFISDDGFTTAIPEPTSLAIWSLLGLAGAGYGWRRRRGKREH